MNERILRIILDSSILNVRSINMFEKIRINEIIKIPDNEA